jgi:hypothetical protein
MPDEFELRRAIDRAAKAKSLIENEMLNEAFQTLEKSYMDAWRLTKAEDTNAREALFKAVHQIAKVKDHLHGVLSNGSIAQKEIDRLYADLERKKRFGII